MQFIVYLLVYPILWIISILPFRLLYIFSDFVFVIVYYIIGYRKKTVRQNLSIAMPLATKKERLIVEKKFYHHMCDLFLEMIKTLTISEKTMDEHFTVKNIALMQEMEKKGKSIILMTSHYASYEWSVSINNKLNFESYLVYKKIANQYFDKLARKIRSKFGANLLTTQETVDKMKENHKNNIPSLYGFASDQSPKAAKIRNWGTFFGVETPLQSGAEALAKEFDMTMMYMYIRKVKRGFYEATFEVITDQPRSFPDYEISQLYMNMAEKQILEAPEFYLWTHKRFKHRKSS